MNNNQINAATFAAAVVAGNPVSGKNEAEIAQKALDLYLSALEVAQKHNDEHPSESTIGFN